MLDIDAPASGDVPVVSGFVNGVLAYVTGFLASVALYSLVGTSVFTRWTFAGLSPVAELGFVFYGGHLVPITGGSATLNYATQVANAGELFVLLVVVVLTSTGYSVAVKDIVPADTRTKMLAGALPTLGYLPLAVLGGFTSPGRPTAWRSPSRSRTSCCSRPSCFPRAWGQSAATSRRCRRPDAEALGRPSYSLRE